MPDISEIHEEMRGLREEYIDLRHTVSAIAAEMTTHNPLKMEILQRIDAQLSAIHIDVAQLKARDDEHRRNQEAFWAHRWPSMGARVKSLESFSYQARGALIFLSVLITAFGATILAKVL